MYGALLHGGRLVIVPHSVARDTHAFSQLLASEGVTVLNQTPSAFYVLSDWLEVHPVALSLKYLIFGGEALDFHKAIRWKEMYPDCRLINMYGITETTVHVTYQELSLEELGRSGARSLIGKALPTLHIQILSSQGKLVPIGVDGELCVGGKGFGSWLFE